MESLMFVWKDSHCECFHFQISCSDFIQKEICSDIQQGTNIQERLLNKPYVNEVTLRGQKPPLKCC